MSEELAPPDPMQAFQERVKEKLRDDIAGMLPDEALAQLVQRAVDEEFFKKRTVKVGGAYSSATEERPSWFVQEVTKVAKPLLEAMVRDYVAEHTEVIKKAVDEFLSSQNLLLLTFAVMRPMTIQDIAEAANAIVTRVRQPY